MKFSLNNVRKVNQIYGSAGDPAPEGVDALVEKIGASLGAVEDVVRFGERFESVLVVKVASCIAHPNADRLHVCMIDDGGKVQNIERDAAGHVQVVCGAPNVREGLVVAWLPPGSTVPESLGKEPFVLEARELRGVISNGMLASPRELTLGDSHEGILELDTNAAPGTPFVEAYNLKDEAVIDIENKMFTHRPDLFGSLGIARELEGIQHRAYKSPAWYALNAEVPAVEGEALPLIVHNELPELVPRFTALTMSNVTVKPSPVWLQILLAELGVKSINNIVDYTNFFMLETGQPLHAYDYDKLKALSDADGATIVVRNPKPDEKIKLLNGKEITPRADAIMIATDKQLIGIGGVMGGSETEVDENTRNIVLEAANFDMYSVRRTSMEHGLFTDAVTRFSKGQSPLQTKPVLAKIVDEIRTYANGKVASELVDVNQLKDRQWMHPPVQLKTDYINARLGSELSAAEMKTLLENVEFRVEVQGEELTVIAPFWRTDIELREDVVEEVGRLYGYDRLPQVLPKRDIKPVVKPPLLELKQQVREQLAKSGANEVLTYSFVPANLLQKATQDPGQAFQVANALSPELQYYRLSLTPSLLENIHPNIKAGYDEFALFELGKGHNLQQIGEDGLPLEFEMLELVYAASDKASQPGAAFYETRQFLIELIRSFGVELEFRRFEAEEPYQVAKPYEHSRSAKVFVKGTELPLGMIGEYKASVRRQFKLPRACAGFGIGLSQLQQALSAAGQKYTSQPRFPRVIQDLTLKVAANLPFQDVADLLETELAKQQPANSWSRLWPLDIYQRSTDDRHKQITFRLSLANYQRTMTDAEVTALLSGLAEAARARFAAEQV